MSDAPTERPTGTVTFLFTDIEGSTRLWEEHPEAMKQALARHDEILESALGDRNGYIFSTAGDAFSACFSDALDAARAALEAQKALEEEDWGALGAVRTRMALHTGVAHERGGDYFGPALNRCARILSAGHGGQVLVSLGTEELVSTRLSDGGALKDLGEHQLKDLGRPERLFQVIHPDLPDEFPPLRTLDEHQNNLPVQLTSFVGREDELRDVVKRLADNRLLTLTGVGGAGKTRLALQAAAESIQDYPEGVWLIELAAVTDPERLPHAVAEALGLTIGQTGAGALALGGEAQPMIETVAEYLQNRELILVFDNCEHLITASAELATYLLQSCPQVTILATSREGLGILGETLWQVPSLALPSVLGLDDGHYTDAMELFSERAEAVNASFRLDETTAPSVAKICRRLDGMPLAIELAAARVRALDVSQIADRLDDSFRLLTGGSRTALPRQQTLLATVDWSYDLLSDPERILFQRLAAFRGGFTLEATEAVGAGGEVEDWEVLDLLTSLVDKSMVAGGKGAGGPGRYRLLETLRQYALGKLTEAGEADEVRGRHAAFFVELAETARPELRGPNQVKWFDRLDDDHDNLRAAMDWSGGSGREEIAVRIAAAIWWFWLVRGHVTEGRDWIEQLERLADAGSEEAATRLRIGGGTLAAFRGDSEAGEADGRAALEKAESLGDPALLGEAHLTLGWAALARDGYEAARRYFEQSLALYSEARDSWGTGWASYGAGWVDRLLVNLEESENHLALATPDLRGSGDVFGLAWVLSARAIVARYRFDYGQATELHDEALRQFQTLRDRGGMGFTYVCLGIVLGLEGDQSAAMEQYEFGERIHRELGTTNLLSELLPLMGETAMELGETDRAVDYFKEGFEIVRGVGDRDQLCMALESLVRAIPFGDFESSARLLGKADQLREEVGRPMPPPYVESTNLARGEIEEALGERAGELFTDGASLSFGAAVDAALETARRITESDLE